MSFAEIDISLWAYIIAFAVIFVAQIYGAFASGDGLIIQPVLIGLGVPANLAMANDTSGSFFAGVSSGWVFYKKNMMPFGTLFWWLPGVVIGPIFGALLLAHLSLFILEVIVFTSVILGALYFLFYRNNKKHFMGNIQTPHKERKVVSFFSGILMGFLTGLGLGGVGILARQLLMFNGLDVRQAMAVSQVVGTIPIIPAFVSYLMLGLIDPLFLFIVSLAFFSGGYVGTHIVVRVDVRLLEKIFMISTIVVAVLVLLLKSGLFRA